MTDYQKKRITLMRKQHIGYATIASNDKRTLPPNSQTEKGHRDEKSKIQRGEAQNITSRAARIPVSILAESDQTGQRGDQRASAADIDAGEQ